MGRAIIRDPKAFLFDEPLSNLDAALRVHMRAEIRKLHDRLGATFVYVTHDQIEAMTMADHVVVMRDGVVEQQGDPLELYDRPANRFVAGFIGSPAMNFVDGTVAEDGTSVALALPERPALRFEGRRQPGERVVVGLRPEHLVVCGPDEPGAFRLAVGVIERTGSTSYIVTDSDAGPDDQCPRPHRSRRRRRLGPHRAAQRPPLSPRTPARRCADNGGTGAGG